MNLVKELEEVLYLPNFMGRSDKTGVNLAVNMILDRINELGLEVVEKEKVEEMENQALEFYKEYSENTNMDCMTPQFNEVIGMCKSLAIFKDSDYISELRLIQNRYDKYLLQ
jgi:hypothetical protein